MRTQRNRREHVERGIYKRTAADGKTIRYEIGYRDSDGRQRWQVVDGGLKAARARLGDVHARKHKGERVAPSPKLTFGEVADKWSETQVAALRPATQALYRTQLEQHLRPLWGSRRLDTLGVDDVASLIETMQTADYRREADTRAAVARIEAANARDGGNRKPRTKPRKIERGYATWTIRSTLVVAGRVFDYAHRRCGWAGENPVRQLERNERPRSDQRDRRVLSGDELDRLLAAADDRYRLIFAFSAMTGARLGETLGLKWRSVDFEGRTVSITHQLERKRTQPSESEDSEADQSGEPRIVELKTKRSRRTVELPTALTTALRAYKLAQPAGQIRDDDLVFATITGKPLEHRNVGGRALARAVKRAKLHALAGLPDPTFHSLRHTHASAWIAAGGDLVELSARLGHTDPSITASVYSHEFEKVARSEARRERLDGMFGGEIKAPAEQPQRSEPTAADVTDLQARRAEG